MKATELIAALEALVEEHGDLPVIAFEEEYRLCKPPALIAWGPEKFMAIECDWDQPAP